MIADKDLASMQQARILAEAAEQAQKMLMTFSQEKLDALVALLAAEADANAAVLAQASYHETGCGRIEDKIIKNRFVTRHMAESLKGMRCVGVLQEDSQKRICQIGVPRGVLCVLCPATNPVSTTVSTALMALKSGNAVVFAPHAKSLKTVSQTVCLLNACASRAGFPESCFSCLNPVTDEGIVELMAHPAVSLVINSGMASLLPAVQQSGKSFIYGGKGNSPVFIERTANLAQAVGDIIASRSFDNGIAPCAEQALVVDAPVVLQVKQMMQACGAYFMSDKEAANLATALFNNDGVQKECSIGLDAFQLAKTGGFVVPADTKILVADRNYVREDDWYTQEISAPVLALYVENNWRNACEKCLELLFHKTGSHTMIIHSHDAEVIRLFAMQKPVSRMLVNTAGVFGGIGMTTNLFPSLTLGGATAGAGFASENISPEHLIYKRIVAYPVRDRCACFDSEQNKAPKTLLAEDPLSALRLALRAALQKINR